MQYIFRQLTTYPESAKHSLLKASDVFVSTRVFEGHPNAVLEVLDSGHELHNVLEHMGAKALPFLAAS